MGHAPRHVACTRITNLKAPGSALLIPLHLSLPFLRALVQLALDARRQGGRLCHQLCCLPVSPPPPAVGRRNGEEEASSNAFASFNASDSASETLFSHAICATIIMIPFPLTAATAPVIDSAGTASLIVSVHVYAPRGRAPCASIFFVSLYASILLLRPRHLFLLLLVPALFLILVREQPLADTGSRRGVSVCMQE